MKFLFQKFFILIIVLTSIASVISFSYSLYNYSNRFSQNQNLANVNSSIQISYNLIYLIIAVIALMVAYYQLNKAREANTIQTLSNIDNNLKSDNYLRKRKKLAQFVLVNGVDHLALWLKKLKSKSHLTDVEETEISCVKNIFENVIYEFEFIGYNYTKKIYSIEDVYQLFSIEIKAYWVLMDELNFISYLRDNRQNPSAGYYDKFEILFNDIVKQGIINEANYWAKPFLRTFYWSFLFKMFHCNNKNKKMREVVEKDRDRISLFLKEEKDLID